MSDIKAGDLVMVAYPTPCCGDREHVGRMFVVDRVKTVRHDHLQCRVCHELTPKVDAAFPALGQGCDVRRLVKLPPHSESKTVERTEEITA